MILPTSVECSATSFFFLYLPLTSCKHIHTTVADKGLVNSFSNSLGLDSVPVYQYSAMTLGFYIRMLRCLL